MRLLLCFVILLSGCDTIRPVTRFEYNGNFYHPAQNKTIDTHKEFIVIGPEAKLGRTSIALLVGPELYENNNKEYTGVQINPRLFYFFNSNTFLHLEADHSFIFDTNDQNTFVLFAIEKRW